MKKFILTILIFAVGLLLINIPLLLIVEEQYYNGYNKINLNYDTYLLADSHGSPLDNYTEEYGIYNFSAPSDSYYDMYRKVQFLIRGAHLKRIIISVDDHSLSKHREALNNLDRSSYYESLAESSNIFEYIRDKYQYYIVLLNSKDRDIAAVYLRSKLALQTKQTAAAAMTKWVELPESQKKENSISKAKSEFSYEESSHSLRTALEDIILLCRKNNVELIGIKFPLSREYIKAIGNKTYNADSTFFKQNLRVLDFKNIYINEDSYFSNEDHLNQLGGKEFVKILSEKCPVTGHK